MDHQKPEDPVQTIFQRIHKNMDRLSFLSTQIPRPACLTWPGGTDLKTPNKPLPYLPQEIQDQICRYAVSTTYEMGESRSARPARTTQAILLSSRRNYDEGLKSLYANSVFRYTIAVNDSITHIIPAYTDDMMHIEVVVDCLLLSDTKLTDAMDSKLWIEQVLHEFAGMHIKRKTFRYYVPWLNPRTALDNLWFCLKPLYWLQGFDTVKIDFDALGNKVWTDFFEALIEKCLDHALGPATAGDGKAKGFFVFGTRYVEFHPNGYRAAKELAE